MALIIVVLILVGLIYILYPRPTMISIDDLKKEAKSKFTLSSPAFKYGEKIPVKYTCDGADVSIPLSWSGYPENTKSFLIIMYDPDAPMGTFIHWIAYNIPGNINSLPENIDKKYKVEGLCFQGINDFGEVGYGGPCPPPGSVHRYFIVVFALDTELKLGENVKISDVLAAVKGHVIAYAEYMGKYGR